MLSSEQKKQKNKASASVLEPGSTYQLRRIISAKYDIDRVTELWANLSMVQQMQGYTHWLDEAQRLGLLWKDYVNKLIRSKSSRVLVIENSDMIFGFLFLTLVNIDTQNPKRKPKLKAIIHEVYVEPAFRKEANQIQMAEKAQELLKNMGVEYIEFAVKDLK